jgi:hypothetical protein
MDSWVPISIEKGISSISFTRFLFVFHYSKRGIEDGFVWGFKSTTGRECFHFYDAFPRSPSIKTRFKFNFHIHLEKCYIFMCVSSSFSPSSFFLLETKIFACIKLHSRKVGERMKDGKTSSFFWSMHHQTFTLLLNQIFREVFEIVTVASGVKVCELMHRDWPGEGR